MKTATAVILIISCLSLFPFSSLSSTPERTSDYDIWWRGFRIGEGKLTTHAAGEGKVAFRSVIHVSAGIPGFRHSLDSFEDAVAGPEGTLSYSRTATENGKKSTSEGTFKNGVFYLDVTANGLHTELVFPRRDYDATTMDCPEKTMGPEKKEMTLRILDLETAGIVIRKYRWIGNERMTIARKDLSANVVDYQDEGKKGRRWLRANEPVVHVLRQDGKGKDGSYSLRIKGFRES